MNETGERTNGSKVFALLYGAYVYLGVWGILLYTVGFVGNYFGPLQHTELADLIPFKSIDMGKQEPPWTAFTINLALLVVLGLQHSGMARPSFKNWWTRVVPKHLERSTYVIVAIIALSLLIWQWRPMPEVIWHGGNPTLRLTLDLISLAGWCTVLWATILVGHWKIFGVAQVMDYIQDREYTKAPCTNPQYYKVGWPFSKSGLWRYARHPDFFGFLVAFWVTPTMTVGHLMYAAGLTIYILIGIYFLERNLKVVWGADYVHYAQTRSKIIPWFVKRSDD
jgi:methanethiol S-methyltransferase